MARMAHFTEEEVQKAQKLRNQATTATELRSALAVIMMAELGLSSEKTAELLGTSRSTIFRKRKDIRNQDKTNPKQSWGGRRRFFLTPEEEKVFLSAWDNKARDGGVLSVPPIHSAFMKQLGRDISPSTTYRILARHGWRKVEPDTKHPKSDPEAQKEFKKNSKKKWQPPV